MRRPAWLAFPPAHPAALVAKLGLLAWGAFSWLQGGAMTFMVNSTLPGPPHPFEFVGYVGIVYAWLGLAAAASFASSWLGLAVCVSCAAAALRLGLRYDFFPAWGDTPHALAWALAVRPGLGAAVFLALALWETRTLRAAGEHDYRSRRARGERES